MVRIPMQDRGILLHICCGPCGTASLERLQKLGPVTLFYSNSNIHPAAEYDQRLVEVRRLACVCGCELIVDEYSHDAWLKAIAGLEAEPERGARCLRCFEFSLGRAAELARKENFSGLTTTLTISPHKRSADIFAIGERLSDRFLDIDFKKGDGFRRSVHLAREYGMFRQTYCGCEFSLR